MHMIEVEVQKYIHALKLLDMTYSYYIRLLFCSGGRSTQIKYLSKSTDTYYKILLQKRKSTAFSILLEWKYKNTDR